MNRTFNFRAADPTWHDCLHFALEQMDQTYLRHLKDSTHWLPGHKNIFRAFSVPLSGTQYILFGESPYPREASANGYAFWDAAVEGLWSPTGLEKAVNRATSLRNLIKMMLVAEGLLSPDETSQECIARIDKTGLVQTSAQLFQNFLSRGFLLLNATLVLQTGKVNSDAKAWHPFLREILAFIALHRPNIKLILFGRIAALLEQMTDDFDRLVAEHPYNLSFITNPEVLEFFRPLSLLRQSPATI